MVIQLLNQNASAVACSGCLNACPHTREMGIADGGCFYLNHVLYTLPFCFGKNGLEKGENMLLSLGSSPHCIWSVLVLLSN